MDGGGIEGEGEEGVCLPSTKRIHVPVAHEV